MRRLLLLALLLSVAFAAVLVLRRVEAGPPGRDGSGSAQATDDPAARAVPVEDEPSRHPITTRPPRIGDVAAEASLLRGTVIDAEGAPLRGATVVVSRVRGDSFALLDRGSIQEPEVVGRVVTGAEGRFAVTLAPAVPHRVEVQADGFGPLLSRPHRAGEDLVLQLDRAAGIEGVVARDGEPVAATRIEVSERRTDGRRGAVLATVDSDARGRYRIDRLAAGEVTLSLEPEVGCAQHGADLRLVAGEVVRCDLVLAAGETVHGRVVDADSGAAIAGAEVRADRDARSCVRSAVDGSFDFRGFGTRRVQLRATARGYAAEDLLVRDGGTLRADLVFHLHRARRAVGRVLAAGRAVEGAYVAAAAYRIETGQPQRLDWIAGRSGPDGSFVLEDLCGDLDHVLLVHADGFGVRQIDFPSEARTLPSVDLGDVVLERGVVLSGRVVDEDGAPCGGRSVELHGSADGRRPPGAAGVDAYVFIDGYVALRRTTSDCDGRFAIADLAPGSYEAMVIGDLGRPEQAVPIRIEGNIVPTEVELHVVRGLSISGRIQVDDGGALPTCYVSVDPLDQGNRATDVQCATDGSFRATGLSRGSYTLSFYPYASESDRAAGRVFATTRVPDVPAGREGVLVVLPRKP
ncbi:MAG: carboxypeptidase-like regulatory domain-containing protein [Planctomycetota bacterium]